MSHMETTKHLNLLMRLSVAWKILLVFVACVSPGNDYDTSTDLLFDAVADTAASSRLPKWLSYVPRKLTRWDAIYFVSTAARGYRLEQEWAFGWGFAKSAKLVATRMWKLCSYRYHDR